MPCTPRAHPVHSRYPVQAFNATANQATSSLLFLSCIGVIVPTAATALTAGKHSVGAGAVLDISRGAAVVLLAVYACYLVGRGEGRGGRGVGEAGSRGDVQPGGCPAWARVAAG